jgi:5'-3' exonuclease
MVTLLIDADSICFQSTVCSKTESESGFVESTEIAVAKFDEKIHLIINTLWENYNVGVNRFALFVGGENNYRKLLFPKTYKISRVKKEKPPLLDFIKTYAQKTYDAHISNGCEADDAIYATWLKLSKNKEETIVIASVDKDLKQIPCKFFDYYYTRMTLEDVSADAAKKMWYTQLLIGDAVDDVNPIKGKGAKFAEKVLAKKQTDFSLMRAVYIEYVKRHKSKARERLIKNSLLISLNGRVTTPEFFVEI